MSDGDRYFVIATADGYVGSYPHGRFDGPFELAGDVPPQFAYCYETEEEARKVAEENFSERHAKVLAVTPPWPQKAEST